MSYVTTRKLVVAPQFVSVSWPVGGTAISDCGGSLSGVPSGAHGENTDSLFAAASTGPLTVTVIPGLPFASASFRWSPGFTPSNVYRSLKLGAPSAGSEYGSTAVTLPPAAITALATPFASVTGAET